MIKFLIKFVFGFLLTVSFIWAAGLIYFYSSIPSSPNLSKEKTDAIIVLTGGSERISEGVRLLREGYGDKLLISGVNKETKLKDLFPTQGLKADDIFMVLSGKVHLGKEAVNTVGNALETAEWVKNQNIKSIRLVTSNYHMPRSMVEFKKTMPGIIIIPSPVFTNKFNKTDWFSDKNSRDLIILEYSKFLVATFKG